MSRYVKKDQDSDKNHKTKQNEKINSRNKRFRFSF